MGESRPRLAVTVDIVDWSSTGDSVKTIIARDRVVLSDGVASGVGETGSCGDGMS